MAEAYQAERTITAVFQQEAQIDNVVLSVL